MTRARVSRLLLGGTFTILVACGGASDSSPSGDSSDASSFHQEPWEWIPSDPVLAAGREVYMAECALCHNEGEEGAPALTHAEDWQKRIAQGEATLVKHAIEGFIGQDGEMPARGGTDTLEDEKVIAAVKYMTSAAQKK